MQQLSVGKAGRTPELKKPAGRNEQGHEEFFWLKDATTMVKIPAGEFTMGSGTGEASYCEGPARKVYLDEFYIDKAPVTNRQFDQFVRATGYLTEAERLGDGLVFDPDNSRWVTRKGVSWRFYYNHATENHPVVLVSWNDARAYCNWVGKRLPTEAEWEKASRGTDAREYPWGIEAPDADGKYRANYWVGTGEAAGGYTRTSPVGAFPAGVSPYGLLDMAGNVLEWCNDWFDPFENYYAEAPNRNPPGPDSGSCRVQRGGSWYNGAGSLRAAARTGGGPSSRSSCNGFRCARSAPF